LTCSMLKNFPSEGPKKDFPLKKSSNCPVSPSSISHVSGSVLLIAAESLSACGL